jgi:hypothetical protein
LSEESWIFLEKGMEMLSAYETSTARRNLGSYALLGAITPADALEQVWPASKVRSGAGHNQALRDGMLPIVSSGIDTAWITADLVNCPAQASTGNNLRLAQTAAGLALTGTQIGLTATGAIAAATLAPFTMGISAIIGLFPIIFGHHAAAVKKEQSVLCAAVPAANNYLEIIDQAVTSGQATPQQGIAGLNSLYSDFGSKVAGIIKGSDPTSAGECNAACVHQTILHAIVLYKASVYQDMASAPGASSGGAPQNISSANVTGSTLTIPQPAPPPPATNWLGIAALIFFGFAAAKFL